LQLLGTLYSASVKDSRLLRCLRAELIEGDIGLFRIFAIVVKNCAPSKLYGSLSLSADSFEVLIKEETADLIASVTRTISENFPSRVDDPHTPPLHVWDTLNYWLHGKFSFLVRNRISTSICIHLGVSELLTINLIAERMEYSSSKNCMDFKGSNFSIYAHAKNFEGEEEVNIESRLFFMPTLLMEHRFNFLGDELSQDYYYGHHDVYLRPEPDESDKFTKFRSKRHSVQYELKVVCSEERCEVNCKT